MTGQDLLEPHLILAGVTLLILIAVCGWAYWRFYRGAE